MRKNQKYSKEEMYLAIELWQENGLSQVKFCFRETSVEKSCHTVGSLSSEFHRNASAFYRIPL